MVAPPSTLMWPGSGCRWELRWGLGRVQKPGWIKLLIRHPPFLPLLIEVVLLIFWAEVEVGGGHGEAGFLLEFLLCCLLIQQQAGISPLQAVCIDFFFILVLVSSLIMRKGE